MPASEPVKVRMKIGAHEFEAEGPADVVIAQLDIWIRAAGLAPPMPTEVAATPPPPAETETRAAPGGTGTSDPALRTLFRVDADRHFITLRARLNGRRRNADAALVLLYGFDTCFGVGDGADIPAARLRDALAASGHAIRRVDRAVAPYVSAGYVRKAGRHKHETYALTASGARHAGTLIRRLVPAG